MRRAAAALAAAAFAACATFGVAAVDGIHVMGERASVTQPANMTRTSVRLERSHQLLTVFGISGDGSNGPAGSTQPGGGFFDPATGRVDGDRQLNVPPNGQYTVATTNSGHDAPALALPADGSAIVAYGAESTYAGDHPPSAWACFLREYCEPFKRVPASGDVVDAMAKAPERLLPSIGLSEMSSATLGDATILAGQQQPASAHGEAGAQGFVSYRGDGRFDTANGTYDSNAGAPPQADGLYTITRTPNDGAYVEFAVTQAQGSGSIALSLDGVSCDLERLPATNAIETADAYVQYANADCPQFRARFQAVRVAYSPLERAMGDAVVGIALRRGDVTALPSGRSARLVCTGGIACATPAGPNTVLDVRASGLHRHFLWGGVTKLGDAIYDILDVQQVTGSWYGPEHNSLALALACFRTKGPRGAQWVWTDCGGGHPFTLSPGQRPEQRLGEGSPYLIKPPLHGWPATMTPFIYDWSMDAQPPASTTHWPVISSEAAALARDGSLVIGYACQDERGSDAICYLAMNARGETTRAGIVAYASDGGSLPSIGLSEDSHGTIVLGALVGVGRRWGCDLNGGCAMSYAYDEASGRWKRESLRALGGPSDIGFAGTVLRANDALLFQYHEANAAGAARIVTIALNLH